MAHGVRAVESLEVVMVHDLFSKILAVFRGDFTGPAVRVAPDPEGLVRRRGLTETMSRCASLVEQMARRIEKLKEDDSPTAREEYITRAKEFDVLLDLMNVLLSVEDPDIINHADVQITHDSVYVSPRFKEEIPTDEVDLVGILEKTAAQFECPPLDMQDSPPVAQKLGLCPPREARLLVEAEKLYARAERLREVANFFSDLAECSLSQNPATRTSFDVCNAVLANDGHIYAVPETSGAHANDEAVYPSSEFDSRANAPSSSVKH